MSNCIHKRLTQHLKGMINQRIYDIERRKSIHEKTLESLKNERLDYINYSVELSSNSGEIRECEDVIKKSKVHINKLLYIKNALHFSNLERVCACLVECSYVKMTHFELSVYLIVGNAWIYKSRLKDIFFINMKPSVNVDLDIY